jgi:glycerol-3-phosphate acyltransferase PlsY
VMVLLLLVLLLAYLVGSIPFAVVVAKFLKTPNPAEHGSKKSWSD